MGFTPAETDASMDVIARTVCTTTLPTSEMISHFMRPGAESDPKMTQPRIARAIQGFVALTRIIMEMQTVAGFIRGRCERDEALVDRDDRKLSCQLVPDPTSKPESFLPTGASALQRAQSGAICTQAEAVDCMTFYEQCPELMVSVIALHEMLDAYLNELRAKIAKIHPEKSEELSMFQEHWALASNFRPYLSLALWMQLPRWLPPERMYASVSQKTIESAFQWLVDSRAFDPLHVIEGEVEKFHFSCPAQQFLRELIVDEQCLMRVVEAVKRLSKRADEPNNPHLTTQKRHLEEIRTGVDRMATLDRIIIKISGIQGFPVLRQVIYNASTGAVAAQPGYVRFDVVAELLKKIFRHV